MSDAPSVQGDDVGPPGDAAASHAPPSAREVGVVALIAFAAAAAVSLRPGVGSELRYIESSRAMLENGDWVVPHLAGVPYMEKPILFYWLAAACQWVLGASDVMSRAPSVLSVAVMVGVTYALAAEWRGPTFGRAAAVVLAGSVAFLPLATGVTTDPLFSATLTLTWYALWRHLRGGGPGWTYGMWAALAAAMLTKGPLGPALVVMSCGVLVVCRRSVRWLWDLRPVTGGLLFLALCAPWHIALYLRDPRLLDFFYIRQNVKAFSDGTINHEGPVYYYVPVLLMLFFPWSVLLVPAFGRALLRVYRACLRPVTGPTPLPLFLAAAVLGPLLLLSAAGSKLGTYVLPLLPFLAVLAADAGAHALRRRGVFLKVATALPAVALVGGVAYGIVRGLSRYDVSTFSPAYVPAMSIAIGLLVTSICVGAVLSWRGRATVLPVVGTGTFAALLVALPFVVEPGAHLDARVPARRVAAARAASDRVVIASRHVQDFAINLELPGPTYILGRARELGMGHFVATHRDGRPLPDRPPDVASENLPEDEYLLDDHELVRMWDGPDRVWLFAREENAVPIRRHAQTPVYPVYDDGDVTVFTNRPYESDH